MNRLLLFCLIVMLTACNSDTKKESTNQPKVETPQTNAETNTTTAKTPATATSAPLPTLPMEKAKYLWENCTYIDYVFYELPFSMSLDKKNDIQGSIRHISASPVSLMNPKCASIGRIFFQVEGENEISAEFYFSTKEGCFYYVFIEDEKPAYANLLTQDAVNYYNKTFSMVSTQANPANQ